MKDEKNPHAVDTPEWQPSWKNMTGAMRTEQAYIADAERYTKLASVGLSPSGLSRAEAAAYVGVSDSHFDKLIALELMPRGKSAAGRVVWIRRALDDALENLPDHAHGGPCQPPAETDVSGAGPRCDNAPCPS